ncbi:XrtA/PEP-CTERM system histidine kinase PrsK [Altererythrobacter sp. MF3-039]|uniref:XrtA/PEP-CTERM system histidine kinase PrsK n=1 Tax=Altererythrobacter sp. MF3-039 TaxID=3252901 RepID=UPI00390C95AA
MISGNSEWLTVLGTLSFMLGAIASISAAAWIYRSGDRQRPDRQALVSALCLTALWCVTLAAYGTGTFLASITEAARNLAWLAVLLRLFSNDGRDASMAPVRPVIIVLSFVVCLQPILASVVHDFARAGEFSALAVQISTLFHLLVAVGALVLLHNLYGGAAPTSRQILRWSSAGLAAMWAFDLNYYTVAYLSDSAQVELGALRGVVAALVALALALGARSSTAGLNFKPSRAVTFQSLSLILIGAYLMAMIAIARSLSLFPGDLARMTQVGFVVAATTVAFLWLPSKKMRSWLRVTAAKHLFQHRYDYRAEWLRFNATIGSGGASALSLQERAVQALADITDSPCGLLLTPADDGSLALAARWQWRAIEVPGTALSDELGHLLERENFILDLDEVRSGVDRHGEAEQVPGWLLEDEQIWALVPLSHFDRLVGVVVLARPPHARSLDWEDFDLLRVVGQQLASYLAEHAGQQALMESSRFDEFNRRIAFVMHDIKNLSSQISLLLRNAEKHADKPEFREDMLVTLRNSSDKLNHLLARLGRYGTDAVSKRDRLDLSQVAHQVGKRFENSHPVTVVALEPCTVSGDQEAIEQAVVHLVQNAIDASDDSASVFVEVTNDGVLGRLEVVDSGCGMSPQFIRSSLFKPFVSSKADGFGIGAFEARELVRTMGGRLEVESREGLGSRFALCLPLHATADFLNTDIPSNAKVA